MGMNKSTTTTAWAVCDKCGDTVKDLREDLLPVRWATMFVEPAPDEYPDEWAPRLAERGPYTWKDLIKPVYKLLLCEHCYGDFKFLFLRKESKKK